MSIEQKHSEETEINHCVNNSDPFSKRSSTVVDWLGRKMPFTATGDPIIERAIRLHMDIIRDSVLSEVKPVSVVLTGSFGRGEGTALIENGCVRPLKDYDILVLVGKKLPRECLDRIETRILARMGESDSTNSDFRYARFTVCVEQTTLRRLQLLRDIATYEIKQGSHLIYGKDVRKEISFDASDIPLSSGLRFLFKKVLGLIFQFEPKKLKSESLDSDRLRHVAYECMKTWVEIGTAISLIGGVYSPSYEQRMRVLRDNPPRILREIETSRPGLRNRITAATEEKLHPTGRLYLENELVPLWITARDDLIMALKVYLDCYVGIGPGSWVNRHETYHRSLVRRYYKDFANGIIQSIVGYSPPGFDRIFSYLYKRYYTWDYVKSLESVKGRFDMEAREVPILRVFTTAPLLAEAVSPESPNENLIRSFRSALSNVYPITERANDGWEAWLDSRQDLYAAFGLWHGQR